MKQIENERLEIEKKICDMKTSVEELKHKFKMEELEYERLSMQYMHNQILERNRIKTAEERKLLHEKERIFH